MVNYDIKGTLQTDRRCAAFEMSECANDLLHESTMACDETDKHSCHVITLGKRESQVGLFFY
jgi:hypothetical protein